MLCKANAHLPDWPMDEMRDIDPTKERYAGWLRAGYIVPLVRQRAEADKPTRGRKPGGENQTG